MESTLVTVEPDMMNSSDESPSRDFVSEEEVETETEGENTTLEAEKSDRKKQRKHVAQPEIRIERFLMHKPNRFFCGFCELDFTAYRELEDHSSRLHERAYVCRKCSGCFKDYLSLRNHIKSFHIARECQECPYCERLVYSPHYESHLAFHKKHSCQSCGKMFGDSNELSAHKKLEEKCRTKADTPTGGECPAYRCDTCNLALKSPEDLQQHKNSVHSSKVMCPHGCGLSFDILEALDAHRTAVHAIKSRKCNKCDDFIHGDLDEFKAHLATHGLELKKRGTRQYFLYRPDYYPCCFCPQIQVFADFGQVKEHLSLVHGRGFACPECSYAYFTLKQREQHYDRVHVQNKNFLCQICQRLIQDKRAYVNHMARHENVVAGAADKIHPSYRCEWCDGAYRSFTTLAKHKRRLCKKIPDEERKKLAKIACPWPGCQEHFMSENYMRKHVKGHSEGKDRPSMPPKRKEFICDRCGSTFVSKQGMLIHLDKIKDCHMRLNESRGRKRKSEG